MKKLIYLSILLTFLFIPGISVKAQTYTLSFNSMRTTSQDLSNSIQCNNNYCVVYNAQFLNQTFSYEWGTTGSPTCSSTAVVSGRLFNDNTNFGINNDDYSYNRVYLINNGSQSNCSFSVNDVITSFVCTSSSLTSNFKIGYTLNPTFGGDTTLNSTIFRSMDINCDTSTGQVIENQNTNTQNIINNNNSNTQNIIDNQSQNTQDIIDNQNANSQAEIESQKVCTSYDKGSVKHSSKILNSNGELDVASASWGVTDYIPISKNYSMQIKQNYSGSSNAYLCFYDDTKTKISCQLEQNTPINTDIPIPNNAAFFRYSIVIFSNVPQLEVCSNGNQALNDSVNNLNDSITDTTSPDTDDYLQDFQGSLASDTPITNLLTLPLTLINAYNNGINANCSPVSLGSLYGTNLVLPCIDLEDFLGSTLWYTIDSLCSIFLIYSIAMLFVHAFDNFTSLKDDFDGMYVPKHAGKHVGSGVDG